MFVEALLATAVRPDAVVIPEDAVPAGQSIVFRGRKDLAIALSACPASECNGGTPKPFADALTHG